jgi:hypothetical protein
MIKKDKKSAIDRFLNINDKSKNLLVKEKDGLIERFDRILVTKDGKQLLREQY